MSQQRILRSSRKVLPDVVPVISVKKTSRKILFRTSGDLSNTPKESENEDEVPKKKPRKKTIRRTQNSFYIENESKIEAIEGMLTEQLNSKTTRRLEKKKFDSSDYDSVFEEDLPTSKCLKSSIKLRLPRVELDDFQESNEHKRKIKKESYTNKGLKSNHRHNMVYEDSPGVHKKKEQYWIQGGNKNSEKKRPAILVSTDEVKETLRKNTSIKKNKKVEIVDDKDQIGENKENSPKKEKRFSKSKKIEVHENSGFYNLYEFTEKGKQNEVNELRINEFNKLNMKLRTDKSRRSNSPESVIANSDLSSNHDNSNFNLHHAQNLRKCSKIGAESGNIFSCNIQADFDNHASCPKEDETMENVEGFRGKNPTTGNGACSRSSSDSDGQIITQETETSANAKKRSRTFSTRKDTSENNMAEFETFSTNSISKEKVQSDTMQDDEALRRTEKQLKILQTSVADINSSRSTTVNNILSNYQNDCSTAFVELCGDEDQIIFNKNSRLSGTSNVFVDEDDTSEESDFKNKGQEKNKQMKKRSRHSNRTAKKSANYSSESKTCPKKSIFVNGGQKFLKSGGSRSITLRTNEEVQYISERGDSSSDSEIEFNCYPKDALELASDFPLTTGKIEISKKDLVDTINTKKILFETKFDSNTNSQRRSNISMNVTTIKCEDNLIGFSGVKSLTKENNISLSGRGRKRWTLLEGPEARRSFQVQIDNLRKSLMTSKKSEGIPQDNKFLKHRCSNRKRWSNELRKCGSALDVSISAKNNFVPEEDVLVTDEVLMDMEVDDGLALKSRRSRSLTSLESSPNGMEKSERLSATRSPDKPIVSSKLGEYNKQISFPKINTSDNDESSSKSLASKVHKRWTVLEGPEASRSFQAQKDNLRKSLMTPKKSQGIPQDIKFLKPRRSNRKRWSNELRKCGSALDVSISSKNNFAPEEDDLVTDEVLADMKVDDGLSIKSRRSSSLTSLQSSPNGMEKSKKSSTTTSSIISETDKPIASGKLGEFNKEISFTMDNISDHDESSTNYLAPSISKRRSRSLSDDSGSSPIRKTTSNYRRRTFERRTSAGFQVDLATNQSMEIESKSVSIQKITKESTDFSSCTSVFSENFDNLQLEPTSEDKNITVSHKSKLCASNLGTIPQSDTKNKNDTFGKEETVNDISLLQSHCIMPSTSMGLPSSSTDTLASSPKTKCFKRYKSTPYVKKSKPDITPDTPGNSTIQIQGKSFGMEYSMNDTHLLSPSSMRLSTSRTDALDNIQLMTSHKSKSPQNVSKSPSKRTGRLRSSTNNLDTSTISGKCKSTTPHNRKSNKNILIVDLSNPSQQSTKRTFEIEESVNDIGLLRTTASRQSSNIRRLRSSTNSLDTSTETGKCKTTTPHNQKTNENTLIVNLSNPSGKSTRRTFEIEESVNDISLLRATASRQSSNMRRSSSLVDTLDIPPIKKRFKGYRVTPHVRKSKPKFPIDDASNDSNIQIEGRTVIKDSIHYIDLTLSPNIRRSTSLTDTTDNFSLSTSSNICARPSTSTGNLATPGSILKRRDTYELNESVTDINLLKSLSDSTLTDIGVNFLPDESVSLNVCKRVRFENVTQRRVLKRTEKGPEADEDQRTHKNKATVTKNVSFRKSVGTKRSMSLDHTFFSPPSSSSTPKYPPQKPTSQKTSTKDMKDTLYGRRRSRSADEGNSKITRIRMPNFAKIHERARDRMENIVQLTERKAERARLLLSGQKPTESSSWLSDVTLEENVVKQSHKQLNFDKSQASTSKSFLRVVQNESNTNKTQMKNETKKLIGVHLNKNKQIAESWKNNTNKTQIKNETKELVRVHLNKNKQIAGSTNIPISNEMKAVGSSKTGFLKVTIPEKLKNAGRALPPNTIEQNKVTQFGFKIKTDAGTEAKAVQKKALATKTKVQQDHREERRTVVKGVRGNRRFELLMKMRKN